MALRLRESLTAFSKAGDLGVNVIVDYLRREFGNCLDREEGCGGGMDGLLRVEEMTYVVEGWLGGGGRWWGAEIWVEVAKVLFNEFWKAKSETSLLKSIPYLRPDLVFPPRSLHLDNMLFIITL